MATSGTLANLQVEVTNRQILKIALPISLAILVPQFNLITNNIFLGHFSQHALATASITGVYYLIFAMIGFGLTGGLQTLIARRAGENRPGEIGRIFGQGVFISLIIAAAGILATWFLAPAILRRVLHNPIMAEDAIRYLRIRIWGLPFLYIYQMRHALLVGTNNGRFLVIGTLAETLTNIAFDYLFIFGHFGFPQLGLNGAAVASIIAEFSGMLVIFIVIHRKGISQQFALFRHLTWNRTYATQILTISLPLIVQVAISITSWEFFYILVEHHGQEALAVSNVMRNVFGLVGCFTWAFAATSSTMVSNIIGQGRKDEVPALIRKIVRISMSLALVLGVLMNLFPRLLLSVYGQDASFIEAGVPLVRTVTVAMFIMSISVVWLNAVTGTGNSRATLLIELVTILLYCVYVYLILEHFNLAIIYGWMSEWLYWSSILLLSFMYIRSGHWRKKKL